MKVKFTNLYKLISDKPKIIKKINYLIKNSKFVVGREVEDFEKNFSNFVKAKYCVSVANGTDALEIAIASLNLKENTEIILPVNTWISTAEAIVSNGLKPIFCDVNLSDYSICTEDLKKLIKKLEQLSLYISRKSFKPKEIKKILKKNIKIIEDCAQAHGSKIGKNHVGMFGDIGTFSFFPGKNLGGFGDGGAILTNSKEIYEYALRARNHGARIKYDHKFSGRNSRLDTINAAY